MGQQGSYPIGSRVINLATDTATGLVTGGTCDIPLNQLAQAIQTFLGLTVPFAISSGGTGATTAPTALANLGVKSMGTQDAGSVAITGGTITGVTINNATVGGSTVIGVANGGTGTNSLTTGAVVIGAGTGPVTLAAPGASGNVLTSTGPSSPPTFQTPVTAAVTSVTAGTGMTVAPTTGAVVVSLTNPVPISLGGTGASTASGAQLNLQVPPSTYTRTEINAQSLTWQNRVQAQWLNLKDFYTGGTSDDTALTNALASAAASGRTLYIPAGLGSSANVTGGYAMTTANKIWKVFSHSVFCEQGVVFDLVGINAPGSYTDPASGLFGSVMPNFFIKARDTYNLINTETQHYWHGGRLYFSNASARQGVSGFFLGDDYGSTGNGCAGALFDRIDMQEPDIGFTIGNNCYLNTWNKCIFEQSRMIAFFAAHGNASFNKTNSGENFKLHNCLFGDSQNGSMMIDSHSSDIYVHNSSFDFNGGGLAICRGLSWIRVMESHIEWSNNTTTYLFNPDSGDGSLGNLIHADRCLFTHDTGTQSQVLFHGSAFGQTIVTRSTMNEGGTYSPSQFADSSFTTIDLVKGGTQYGLAAWGRTVTSPTIAGHTTPGTITYTTNVGNFCINNGYCYFTATLIWTAIGTGAGTLDISPVAFNTVTNTAGTDVVVSVSSPTIVVTSGNRLEARVLSGSQLVNLYQVAPGGGATAITIPSTGTVYLSGFWPVNS